MHRSIKHLQYVAHTLTHIYLPQRQIPQECPLFPREEGFGFICPFSAGFIALRLFLGSLSVWTFSFVDQPDSIWGKSLSFSPWGVHVHRDTEKETTRVWPATILTNQHENMSAASFFQTISSFLYSPQVSSGHLEIKTPYLTTLPVDKAFVFL